MESSSNGTTFYFTLPYTKSKFNTLTSVIVPKTKIIPSVVKTKEIIIRKYERPLNIFIKLTFRF